MSLLGNFCPYLEMSSIERKLCKIWNDILFWQHLDSENNVLTWNLNMKTLLRILNSSCPYLEIYVLTWKWALLGEKLCKYWYDIIILFLDMLLAETIFKCDIYFQIRFVFLNRCFWIQYWCWFDVVLILLFAFRYFQQTYSALLLFPLNQRSQESSIIFTIFTKAKIE